MAISKYPQGLRERATRLALEAHRDPASRSGAITRIADQSAVGKESLRTWVRKAETDQLTVESVDAQDRIRQLEKKTVSSAGPMRPLKSSLLTERLGETYLIKFGG